MSDTNNLELPILNKMLEKVKLKGDTTSESGIGLSPELTSKKSTTVSPLVTKDVQGLVRL